MTRNVDPEQYLRSLGYSGTLEEMTAHYQWFNGLKSDGVLGPKTEAMLDNPRRCGMPDMMQNRDCKWNRLAVTWQASLLLRQMSSQQAAAIFDTACRQWNAVCGIQLQPASPRAPDIYAKHGSGRADDFDGPGGVLAWSEMPCGNRERQLQQRYDDAENWTDQFLLAVVCHEVGHAIGIPHINNGNLMAPYYNPSVTRPQAGDIAEAVRRYGPPVANPVPPTTPGDPWPPPADGRGSLDVVIDGRRYIGTADLRPVE